MGDSITVDVECGSCGGTGLYQGFAEPKDTAVVCLTCQGSGKAQLTYRPFTGRKPRAGISWVKRSRGSFIATGTGPVGAPIPYHEFENGRMP